MKNFKELPLSELLASVKEHYKNAKSVELQITKQIIYIDKDSIQISPRQPSRNICAKCVNTNRLVRVYTENKINGTYQLLKIAKFLNPDNNSDSEEFILHDHIQSIGHPEFHGQIIGESKLQYMILCDHPASMKIKLLSTQICKLFRIRLRCNLNDLSCMRIDKYDAQLFKDKELENKQSHHREMFLDNISKINLGFDDLMPLVPQIYPTSTILCIEIHHDNVESLIDIAIRKSQKSTYKQITLLKF